MTDTLEDQEAYAAAERLLGVPLVLPLAPGEPAALLGTRGDTEEASRWTLHELDAGSGYAAALAVEGSSWQLKCWQWPEEPK